MRVYLHKQNPAQRPSSFSLAHGHPIHDLQSSTDVDELKAGSAGTASRGCAHDFSRIPLYPPATPEIQTKLAISNSADAYEREADRISERVTDMPEPQVKCACADVGKLPQVSGRTTGKVTRSSASPIDSTSAREVGASPIAHEVLRSPGNHKELEVSQGVQAQIEGLRGRGEQLPEYFRAYFEPRFGYDFGAVRVHTGSQAAEAAQSINAKAFTVGRDVAFGAGQYSPQTSAGLRLLAHELTHVIQQNGGTPGRLDGTKQGFIIQRQPGTDYGLAGAGSRTKYVAEAIRLWTTQNPQNPMKVEDFAKALMTAIMADLKSQGVPDVKVTMKPGLDAAGLFDSKNWVVEINPEKFSEHKVKTVADLNKEEIKEIVGTLYHESRHSDQDVLIIRVLLDQKKSVKAIHTETDIPEHIIKTVKATKFKTPLDKDQVAHANRMFTVMYGEHKEFLNFLMKNLTTVDNVQNLVNPTKANLKKAAPDVEKLAKWAKTRLAAEVKPLAAKTKPEPQEVTLKVDLDAFIQATADLEAAFNAATASKQPTQDPQDLLDELKDKAEAWQKKLTDAYRNLENEEDAFRVEDLVKADFKKAAAAKANTAPPKKN